MTRPLPRAGNRKQVVQKAGCRQLVCAFSGVWLALEPPVEGWTDGQKTVTAPAEGMGALSCSSRSWQGEGGGGAGHVRWLLELFPKQVGLTALRWGSVTLDMSQRSFLDLFCLLVRDLTFLYNIPSGSDIPRIWSAIISLNPSSIREVFLWVLESQWIFIKITITQRGKMH